ncbi:MAG TPA: hypothetical protein VMR62_00110 [Bryobacteraceae bacterium]|nr:hypothetical protein [Bryobacteraceae bacterium]
MTRRLAGDVDPSILLRFGELSLIAQGVCELIQAPEIYRRVGFSRALFSA